MNIKSLRWQDIYSFFPEIKRQEFNYSYNKNEILKELAVHIKHPISSQDIDQIIHSLQNSSKLSLTIEQIKQQFHGLDLSLFPSIRKAYTPSCFSDDFKAKSIALAIKPFFTKIIPNLDLNDLDTLCECTFECFQEAYVLDKNYWVDANPHITSIILSRIMPQIISKMSRQKNGALFSYASHLRNHLSYWKENQYLFEKEHGLPCSDPQNGICYKMFGTNNKRSNVSLETLNDLYAICGSDPITQEEFEESLRKEDQEIKKINEERNRYLKKVI